MNIVFVCLAFALARPGISLAMEHDTIRMMQYNLMYYTNNSGVSDCNSVTNSLDSKDANIRTIFQYVRPDVFCVCEMGSSNEYADRLLNNVLNTDGASYYRRCPLTNQSGGYIANMLYYDSRRFSLHSNHTITTPYRDINGYKMYYNSTGLAQGDTVFITFWIAHLKAGNSADNEDIRHAQVNRLMNKIVQIGEPGNNIFSGDFNFYSSDESGYKELVEYQNSLYRFYDPINRPGHWHANSQFSDIHTQSTRTSSEGCFSTGGLDDRFDIILASPYVYFGSSRVGIIENSYHALGQDGMRYNGSIVSPANNSIPPHVATALYNQSDHLPVIMDLYIDATVGVEDRNNDFFVNVANPVDKTLTIELHNDKEDSYMIEIYTVDGRIASRSAEWLGPGLHTLKYPLHVSRGMYILVVRDSEGKRATKKIISQ